MQQLLLLFQSISTGDKVNMNELKKKKSFSAHTLEVSVLRKTSLPASAALPLSLSLSPLLHLIFFFFFFSIVSGFFIAITHLPLPSGNHSHDGDNDAGFS